MMRDFMTRSWLYRTPACMAPFKGAYAYAARARLQNRNGVFRVIAKHLTK
jgi:hypothetical protein